MTDPTRQDVDIETVKQALRTGFINEEEWIALDRIERRLARLERLEAIESTVRKELAWYDSEGTIDLKNLRAALAAHPSEETPDA